MEGESYEMMVVEQQEVMSWHSQLYSGVSCCEGACDRQGTYSILVQNRNPAQVVGLLEQCTHLVHYPLLTKMKMYFCYVNYYSTLQKAVS